MNNLTNDVMFISIGASQQIFNGQLFFSIMVRDENDESKVIFPTTSRTARQIG